MLSTSVQQLLHCESLLFLLQQIMKQAQLKLTVRIHKVKLQVKFPCSITATLKVENDEVPYAQQAPLRVGEAVLEQEVSHQFTLLYDSTRRVYEQKKIAVQLFLKSSSGRIPAGSVSLSLNAIGKGVFKETASIEKCPDKYAVLELSISFETLNQAECLSGEQGLKKYTSEVSPRPNSGLSNRKSFKGSMVDKSPYASKAVYNEQEGPSPKTNKQIQEQQASNLQKSYSRGRQDFDRQSSHSPTLNNYTEYSVKSKANQLERQIKNYQSKYEQQNLELKSCQAKRDLLQKSLKQNEGQLRITRERYDDLKAQYQNLLKKNEYKDQSLKEQIKTLTEKYAQSQSEKQRMIFEKNDLVNLFQEREKTLRLGLKEKEKEVSKQKIQLSKNFEKLNNQYSLLKAQHEESDIKENQANRELAKERKKYQELNNARNQLLDEIGLLKTQLNQERAQRRQLEEQLGQNAELQEEKKKFRRKIGDLEQEITKQLKINATAEVNAQKYQRKSQELQQGLKEKISILKNTQKQLETALKEVQTLKSSLQERERKTEQFSFSKQKQLQKLQSTIKDMSDNLKRSQEEQKATVRELKQKQAQISKIRQQIQSSNSDLSSLGKKNSELQIQLLEQRSNYTKLQMQYEDTVNEFNALEIHKTELQAEISSYIQEIQRITAERKAETAQNEDQKRTLEQSLKKLSYSLQNSNEESSFQIKELQIKIDALTNQSNQKSEDIAALNQHIETVEEEKGKLLINIEELQYNLKIKEKQASFLNESLEKAHQEINSSIGENKKLADQIISLKKKLDETQVELERVNEELNQANSSGSNTKQQLEKYRSKNIEDISNFLNAIQGGIIDFSPQHQEEELVVLMQQAIQRNGQFVVETDALYKQLEEQHQLLKNDYQVLREELKKIEEIQDNTAQELQQTSAQLKTALLSNSQLQKTVNKLQGIINNQKESSSSESSKLNNQITILKEKVEELNGSLKQKSNKCNELDRSLTAVSKQLKELENKSAGQKKSSSSQIEQLENQLEKRKKQIEAKAATIFKYGQIEKQLRDNLQDANKQITALKDVNQNIRKRNQKGTARQKQLEDEVAIIKEKLAVLTKKEGQAQKTIKQNNIQINNLKGAFNKLEAEQKKERAELQAARSTIKFKQDLILKNENQNNSLQQRVNELQVQCEAGIKQVERLNSVLLELGQVKANLEQKINDLGTAMNKKQKTHNLEAEYLKPIKDNIVYLRGHMAEYSRVGDQFESNKNKLMKLANTRLEQYTDRNVAEKLRQVSLVFQKLKAYLLSGAGLTQGQKEGVSEQMKRVQLALDRSLRGDR